MRNRGGAIFNLVSLVTMVTNLALVTLHATPLPVRASTGAVCTRTLSYLGTTTGTLTSVAAISPKDVWLAGTTAGGSLFHWDAKHWRVVARPGSTYTTLTSISAVGTADVWAVGSGDTNPTLTEHWDGRRWQFVPDVPVLRAGVYGIGLHSVAALTSDDVWAVGAVGGMPSQGGEQPFIERWDGQHWHSVPISLDERTLVQGRNFVHYQAVAALAPDAAWIAGMEDNNGPAALFDYWDGHTWQSAPSPRFSYVELFAIAPVTGTDVWAVGAHGDPAGVPYTPYIVHWDGTQLREVHGVYVAPDRSKGSGLSGVAALSTTDVWAVGSLVERWDGTRWHRIPTPASDYYNAVAVGGPHDLWVVGGRYYSSEHYVPVVEHFHGLGC